MQNHTLHIAPQPTAPARQAVPARTPYHSLGDEQGMRVPAWALHRSVYRSEGRTLYLVETDRLDAAQSDLSVLDQAGWDVRVMAAPGSTARIALTRREMTRAA